MGGVSVGLTEKLFDLVREVAHSLCGVQRCACIAQSRPCLHVTIARKGFTVPKGWRPGSLTTHNAMTILSTLRQSSQPALTSFVKTYSAHRPLIQRLLTAGFIAHVLAGTFRGLTSRPPTSKSKSKGKDRDGSKTSASEKLPRVAVRLHHLSLLD